MVKLFRVKDLVIRCTQEEVDVEICTNQDAVIYLYREPSYKIEKRTKYTIEVLENFGKENEKVLYDNDTMNKDKANEIYVTMVGYCKM